ncbi:hypothetical protein Ahy_A04g018761 [Arachis hypogaea]|uniref:Band 7 domain-containing protein n=1 Tax=Arachis hypogaea TaxID=3818 RepID=A0A445DEH2_ARAHY|nr:hypothetical protein Ahy_A04g018761 [Arachis hypogaea]
MGQALGCYQVEESNVAIKEYFGKFEEILEPGCHCLPWCLGYRIAGELSLRVQQLEVRCETKTKVECFLSSICTVSWDHAFVTVVASVQYQALADKASDAFYRLSNTRGQIQSYVFDGRWGGFSASFVHVIRASVPKLELDAVLEQKNDIAKSVEEELEKAMSTYGYQIVQTLIVDIEPDTNVKRAMNEINAAARLRVAANEKGEAEKILQIKKAEGEAESKYLSGLGMARQRRAIVDGLRDGVLAFSENVTGTRTKDVMEMVLMTQYFDTVKDIATQVRDGLLQGNASQNLIQEL